MPQNFRYIALICAALPEAKIIHVYRDPRATCWSNYRHYFAGKGLGYSNNLEDITTYYVLYRDLMSYWQQFYSEQIYNLDYEMLTTGQDLETRTLIRSLGLSWQEACLAPQNNKRAIKTASSQQVRQKIYKGSSKAWRKYEKYLGGTLDAVAE